MLLHGMKGMKITIPTKNPNTATYIELPYLNSYSRNLFPKIN
jgi:hypothetical protein